MGRHRHLSEERLSEYLSGRLSSREGNRVERARAECARCREELESLSQTRMLLQSLPEFEPPRSFVLAAAPAGEVALAATPARPAVLRAPGWAYAGAAALAGLAVVLFVAAGVTDMGWPGNGDGYSDNLAMSAPAPQEASVEMAAMEEAAPARDAPVQVERAMMVEAEPAGQRRRRNPRRCWARLSRARW